jgi:toxin ParE1/3/4
MPSYEFSPGAREELREIIARIKCDDEFAAEKWFAHLHDKCGNLAFSPRIGRIREDITPNLYMFPFGEYLIFYDVVKGGIQVVHVVHGRQDVRRMFADTRA